MKNKRGTLNLRQKQQLSEVMGNTAVAVFSIGALNPLFTQQINKFIGFQLIASVVVAIIVEVISLDILKNDQTF